MTAIAIEAFWKSAAILGIALLINIALRRKSADLRRLILSSAIATLFLAAFASAILPRWNTELPIVSRAMELSNAAPPVAFAFTPANIAPTPTPHREMPNPVTILWLAGTAILLTRFLLALRSLRRLRNSSAQIREINGIPILQGETIAAPVTWGILRPVILVPNTFDQLPEESRDAILAHELAHIQSHDFALRTLAEIARAILWFQPLIWIARRHLRHEQELACDDRVLESGANPSAYAKLLLNWNAGSDSLLATAFGSHLKQRICALLDQNTRRTRISSKALLLACPLALATAIPLAAITFTETPLRQLVITFRPPTSPAMEQFAPHPQRIAQLAQNQPRPSAPPAPGTSAIAVVPMPALTGSSLLVATPIAITNQTTHAAIPGLGVDDFILKEDGVPQVIRFAEYQQVINSDNAISSYYVLGYYTSNTSSNPLYRRISISLKDASLAANATLRYREGYFVGTVTVTPTDDGRFHGQAGPGSSPAAVDSPANTLPAGVTKPVLIYKIDPGYSDEARKAKYSGTVELSVLVDETGKVTAVNVVHPLGMGLDEKAVEAVRQWRFHPATEDGKPIAVQTQISMNFRLL